MLRKCWVRGYYGFSHLGTCPMKPGPLDAQSKNVPGSTQVHIRGSCDKASAGVKKKPKQGEKGKQKKKGDERVQTVYVTTLNGGGTCPFQIPLKNHLTQLFLGIDRVTRDIGMDNHVDGWSFIPCCFSKRSSSKTLVHFVRSCLVL